MPHINLPNLRLTLVGGYKIPRYRASTHPHSVSSTGFVEGGLSVYTDGGTVRVFHENTEQLIESTTTAAIGTGTDPTAWPTLTESADADHFWSKNDLFDTTNDNDMAPSGIVYDPVEDYLWTTAKSNYYGTAEQVDYWIAAVDMSTRTIDTNARPTSFTSLDMQRYGGGLDLVPEAFKANVGNRRLAMITAGARSGWAGGSSGTSLSTLSETPGASPDFVNHMYYSSGIQIPGDYEGTRSTVEGGYTDYNNTFDDGSIAVSYAHNAVNDIGYFATSRCTGGGAWIEAGGTSWVIYGTTHPIGVLDYVGFYSNGESKSRNPGGGTGGNQTENLAYQRSPHLYLLTQAQIQAVLDGAADDSQKAYNVRWTTDTGALVNVQSGLQGHFDTLRGMSYDRGSGYLWALWEGQWSSGVESHPAISAYSISTGACPIAVDAPSIVVQGGGGATPASTLQLDADGVWNPNGAGTVERMNQWTARYPGLVPEWRPISNATGPTFVGEDYEGYINHNGETDRTNQQIRLEQRGAGDNGFDPDEVLYSNIITLDGSASPSPGDPPNATAYGELVI